METITKNRYSVSVVDAQRGASQQWKEEVESAAKEELYAIECGRRNAKLGAKLLEIMDRRGLSRPDDDALAYWTILETIEEAPRVRRAMAGGDFALSLHGATAEDRLAR